MRLLLFFSFIFSFNFAVGQQDIVLPGVVVEQNSKKTTGEVNYLSNVSITSSGAISQLSDVNGRFKLIFTDVPIGSKVTVVAMKNYYEVVNFKELQNATILGRKTPLKIVMCKKGKLYENQISYYNIAKDLIVKDLNEKINSLTQQSIESRSIIQSLKEEFDKLSLSSLEAKTLLESQLQSSNQIAKELSERFASVNLDDESETYNKAFDFFINKNLDEAIKLLKEVDIKYRLEKNVNQLETEKKLISSLNNKIEVRKNQINQDVKQSILMARIFLINNDLKSFEEYFDLALKYEFNLNIVQEYSKTLINLGRYSKALDILNEAIYRIEQLEGYSNNVSLELLHGIYFNYGFLNQKIHEHEKANYFLQKSLKYAQYANLTSSRESYLELIRTYLTLGMGSYNSNHHLNMYYLNEAEDLLMSYSYIENEEYQILYQLTLNRLAVYYLKNDQHLLYLTYWDRYENSLYQFSKSRPNRDIGYFTTLSDIEIERGNYNSALNHIVNSLEIIEDNFDSSEDNTQFLKMLVLKNQGLAYQSVRLKSNFPFFNSKDMMIEISSFKDALEIADRLYKKENMAYGQYYLDLSFLLLNSYMYLLRNNGGFENKIKGLELLSEIQDKLKFYNKVNANIYNKFNIHYKKYYKVFRYFSNEEYIIWKEVNSLNRLSHITDYIDQERIEKKIIYYYNILLKYSSEDIKILNKTQSLNYIRLASHQMLNYKFSEAEKSCLSAFSYDKENIEVDFFLFFAYLYQRKMVEAKAVLKELKISNEWDEEFIEDILRVIKHFEHQGLMNKEIQSIKLNLKLVLNDR